MRPINAISVYDLGFIAPVYSTFTKKKVEELELFAMPKTNIGRLRDEWAKMAFMMKVPIFILTKMVNYDIKIIYCKEDDEAYFLPTEADIVGSDLETARLMRGDMQETTEALKINPKAYMSDGCLPDVAQILTPVSRYVTFLAESRTSTWLRLCDALNEKTLSKQFASVLQSIISSEDTTS